MEARAWTHETRLLAMIANAVNQNTLATGHWDPKKLPDIPVVGPLEWDPKRKKRMEIKERVQKGEFTTAEILKAMGKHG